MRLAVLIVCLCTALTSVFGQEMQRGGRLRGHPLHPNKAVRLPMSLSTNLMLWLANDKDRGTNGPAIRYSAARPLGYDATQTIAASIPQRIGQRLYFGGNSDVDYLNISSNLCNSMGAGFTIFAQINMTTALNSQYDDIFSTVNSAVDGVRFCHDFSGYLQMILYDSGSGNTRSRYVLVPLTSNVNYSVAGTWSGQGFASTNISLFLNGSKVDTTTSEAGTVNSWDAVDTSAAVGATVTAGALSHQFHGYIDNLMIFIPALTPSQVSNLTVLLQ